MSREAEVAQRLRRRLAVALRHSGPRGAILSVGLRAPSAPLSRMWGALPGLKGALYSPAEGVRALGLGATAELALSAHDAKAMRRWAAGIFARVQRVGDRSRLTTPRLLGGGAFSSTSAVTAPWSAFGALQFRLPRWTYVVEKDRAALIFSAPCEQLSDPARPLRELELILAALRQVPVRSGPRDATVRQLAWPQWNALMRSALSEIRHGRVRKLVLARRAALLRPRAWDLAQVVERLCAAPGSSAFALDTGAGCFAGATPERLVLKRGLQIRTEALAGSAARGAESGLRRRPKDLHEHRLVVEEIARRLRPRCGALILGARPALRQLADVTHLHTPIRGRLKRDDHILDLALRLHPTPAVGGLPTARAVAWIARHEPVARGWYAGFFGGFDAQGDGQLSVSIRSGLVRGARAWLYAGAGIVAQSDAAAEYAETAIKQRPFLRALGVIA